MRSTWHPFIDTDMANMAKIRCLLITRSYIVSILFKGLPNDGIIATIDDVIAICTSIIFTCTAQHAAINFCQYDAYAFAPNYPFRLSGKPPKDKVVNFLLCLRCS